MGSGYYPLVVNKRAATEWQFAAVLAFDGHVPGPCTWYGILSSDNATTPEVDDTTFGILF